MRPLDTLLAGVEILDPIMRANGFRFSGAHTGHGSGGNFACGDYVRGDRRLELHFRHSLGMVTYHAGDVFLSHEAYMRALNAPACAIDYPGFSDEPLDGLRHLAHDLDRYCAEFLSGDAAILRSAAPAEASRLAAEWRERQAGYAGDGRKRQEARRLFRIGEYGRVVALLDSLDYPDLLTPAERKALTIARHREQTRQTGPPSA